MQKHCLASESLHSASEQQIEFKWKGETLQERGPTEDKTEAYNHWESTVQLTTPTRPECGGVLCGKRKGKPLAELGKRENGKNMMTWKEVTTSASRSRKRLDEDLASTFETGTLLVTRQVQPSLEGKSQIREGERKA